MTIGLNLTIKSTDAMINSALMLPGNNAAIPQILIPCLLTCEQNKWNLGHCFLSPFSLQCYSNLFQISFTFLKFRPSPLAQQMCQTTIHRGTRSHEMGNFHQNPWKKDFPFLLSFFLPVIWKEVSFPTSKELHFLKFPYWEIAKL